MGCIPAGMADLGFEQLHVLFLDRENRLLAGDTVARGTVDEVALPLRSIVHRALDVGASAVILVHNHPSGNPAPSQGDIEATRQLVTVCRPLDIALLDHVILAAGGTTSLRGLGLV